MKTLYPTTRNSISHQLPVDTAMRHPELTPGTHAETDAALASGGVLRLPKGTHCTIVARTTFFADVTVDELEKSEVYHVPVHALKPEEK